MSQVSGERSERVPRARSLPGCVLVCSDRFGVRWVPVRIDAMCCDDPYGTSCFFPFIGQGKARVTVEEKEEKEKEKKSSRIAGPVRHWRHAQASSPDRSAPLCPSRRRGELTRLSILVQGLGRTAQVRLTLFLM